MTETQRRIQELKATLPNVKEKVVAVAVLLAMSIAMMASVSYAWYTLSLAPELGGVTTTVSSNGSLEIALSDFDGKEPEKSGVNDSFSAEGQTTHGANITWGNLINLSGNYGLENLVLRPASLDLDSDKLLYGVKYGEDGRIEDIASNFGFTTWYESAMDYWEFVSPSSYPTAFPNGTIYGVRAISSVAYKGQQDAVLAQLENATALHRQATALYYDLHTKPENVACIEELVDVYLNGTIDAFIAYYMEKLSNKNAVMGEIDMEIDGELIVKLTSMLEELYQAVCKEGDALAYMANIYTKRTDITKDTLLEMTAAQWKALGLENTSKTTGYNNPEKFLGYVELHKQLKSNMEHMQTLENQTTVTWQDIESVVDALIDIDTLTVDGKTVRQLTGMGVDVVDYVNNQMSRTPPIVLYQGMLWSFENICGSYMSMPVHVEISKSVAIISVKYNGNGTMYTSAKLKANSTFADDKQFIQDSSAGSDNRTEVAQDTYGMVLDLWVRSNGSADGESILLTLNGTPEIETYYEQRMIKVSGESVSRPVYTYTYPTGEVVEGIAITDSMMVYVDDDGVCHNVSTYATVYVINEDGTASSNELTDETIVDSETSSTILDFPVMDEKTRVVGFNSANRIWNDDDNLFDDPNDPYDGNHPPVLNPGEISTTQGSGSCYIFYADTPESSARSLELLSHLKLAFVDEKNNLLAEAILDVDHVFAENGKYTVPVAITTSSHFVETEDGTIYGICPLEKNVAKRISVVVYLDGQGLENEMVMSSEDILGSLNIQFDSSVTLRSMGDDALSMEVIDLSAQISKDGQTFGQGLKFEYNGGVHNATLKAVIDGLSPSSVEAVFLRKINASQGSRMTAIKMDPVPGSNEWTGTAAFTKPGTYVLSSLRIDGVDYQLPQKIEVEVSGFNVGLISFDQSPVLTVDRSTTKEVAVTLDADAATMPKTVQAVFMTEDDHAVTATLQQDNAGTWRGAATFNSSGEYTLKFLVMDGEYFDLGEEDPVTGEMVYDKKFTAYLGLTTRIYLQRYTTVLDENGNVVEGKEQQGPLDYILNEDDMPTTTRIVAYATIYDDGDNILKGLDDCILYYVPLGSTIVENGYSFQLSWNGSYYEGQIPEDAAAGAMAQMEKTGTYVFGMLRIGTGKNNFLSSAISAPTLTIRAKDPPAFQVSETAKDEDKILVGSTDKVEYSIDISDASYARNYVVFRNTATEKEYAVLMNKGEGNEYTAAFPYGNDGVQNGTWEVVRVVSAGISYQGVDYPGLGNGTVDTAAEAAAIVAHTHDDQFYEVKTVGGSAVDESVLGTYTVINKVNVTLDAPLTFGKDENGNLTGTFMQSYDFGLKFKVTAPNISAEKLNEVLDSMSVTLNHGGDSATYGSYTTDNVLAPITTTVTGPEIVNGVNVFTASKSVQRAGTYTYTASVMLDGSNTFRNFVNVDTNEDGKADPAIYVWSKRPTVTVGALSTEPGTQSTVLTGNRGSDGSVNYETDATGDFFKKDTYSAVVYLTCNPDWRLTTYVPTVELLLEGIPDGYSATMTFETGNTDSVDSVFDFGTARVAEADVGNASDGSWEIISTTNPKLFPAGLMKQSEITVQYGSVTYEVKLSNEVTINQPQYPPYVDFVVQDTSFDSNNTPARIYGTPQADGTFVVTLPGVSDWVERKSKEDTSSLITDLTNVVPETDNDYKQAYIYSSESMNNVWHKYTINIKTYTATTSSSTWTVTNHVFGWKVGSGTVTVGTTIQVSGGMSVQAVINETHNQDTESTEADMIRTVTTILAGPESETRNKYIGGTPRGYTKVNSKPTAGDTGWVKDE